MRQVERICQSCGATYVGSKYSHYCATCTAKIKSNVIADRICKDCGATFPGGPRAMRCPICRDIARRSNIQKPTIRPLGSTDYCKRCGKEYVVKSGRQKYCPDCQRDSLLEWQRNHKEGYSQKPEIKSRKQEKRENQQKVCKYCKRPFKTDTQTVYCSEYCKKEQEKLNQAVFDSKRGMNRNVKKYEDAREEYRKQFVTPGE